jgi:hypothetical protein
MKTAVDEFVKQCLVCQHAKHDHNKPAGLLQPLPIPSGIWRELTMDFIEGLPMSEGANVIMVIVDRLSKYAHFVPLKHPFNATVVAKAFMDTVVKLHGVPITIVSDRDKIFTSKFWKEVFQLLGTKLQFTTAYHPQTDGQSERVNQCLEMYLRCAVHDTPKTWRKWLSTAELWYNSTHHSSLGCSPFKALYGVEPNLGMLPESAALPQTEAGDFIVDRQKQLEQLKEHLAKAQHRMKMQADKKRSEKSFQVGEHVLLKLQPYAQSSLVNRPCHKLAYKFFGPYSVLEKIGSVAYKLDLPASSAIHPVFHISQLKSFTPDHTPVFHDISQIADLNSDNTWPEEILDRRLVKKGNAAIPQVLVKWSGMPPTMATWEDLYVIRNSFPNALAWGQASSSAGGSVTPAGIAPTAET